MNIRKATEEDKTQIAEMIAADQWHADKGSPDFFFEPGTECMAVEEDGHTFYVRIARALRINAIFDPEQKRANAVLMRKFTEWLAWSARESGYRELVFSTESSDLTRFAERHLGFQASPKDLVRGIEPLVREDSGDTKVSAEPSECCL